MPDEIAGRKMDIYHRWMEVVIGPSMAGLPVAAMPAGFSENGLPTGIQIVGKRTVTANFCNLHWLTSTQHTLH